MTHRLHCLSRAFYLWRITHRYRKPKPVWAFCRLYRLCRYVAGEPRRAWRVNSLLLFWEREVPEYGLDMAMSVLMRDGAEILGEITDEYKEHSDTEEREEK